MSDIIAMPPKPKTQDYMFMASAHGLDNILPVDPDMFHGMTLHCDCNQHRYAIFGTVSLTDMVFKAFEDMMNDDDDKQLALNLIKKTCYHFPVNRAKQYKHNMALIPNPVLDPWGGKRLDVETDKVEIKVCRNQQ